MCVKCTDNPVETTFRNVSIKAINKVEEVKKEIISSNENIISVEWFISDHWYIGYVTYGYSADGQDYSDFIQVLTPMM